MKLSENTIYLAKEDAVNDIEMFEGCYPKTKQKFEIIEERIFRLKRTQ